MTENMFSNNKNNLKISKEVIRIGKLKNDRQHKHLLFNGYIDIVVPGDTNVVHCRYIYINV
jgi:hypothetical protein